MSNLDDKIGEMSRLSSQLNHSMLIQEIWPEAFDEGGCKFSGLQQYARSKGLPRGGLHFMNAYFERADGVRRYLTRDELLRFKPDANIHKSFNQFE